MVRRVWAAGLSVPASRSGHAALGMTAGSYSMVQERASRFQLMFFTPRMRLSAALMVSDLLSAPSKLTPLRAPLPSLRRMRPGT